MAAEAHKKSISAIINSFLNNSDQRCILLSVKSKGLKPERSLQIRFKKYVAEDCEIYLICELIFFDDDQVRTNGPVLFYIDEINDIAEKIASDIMMFEVLVRTAGAESEYNFSEDNTDIDLLSDVRDLEREEIKKFLVKNNYRLHKYLPNTETIIPINKVPEFLEQCFIDQEIKAVYVLMDIKDIGLYTVYLSKTSISDYGEVSREAAIISSDIEREPLVMYCNNPSSKMYDDDIRRKVIENFSNHLDHLIKRIKNKNGVDTIKVQCTCTVIYKYEEIEEGYYEY